MKIQTSGRCRILGPDGRCSGFSLLEILVAFAVASAVGAFAIPSFLNWMSGMQVELAAREVAGVMHQARLYAIRYSANVALRFEIDPRAGETVIALYRDGNANGVRNRDIENGDDPPVFAPRILRRFNDKVSFRFPPGMRPTHPGDPRRRLDRLDDPIRFGRSDLAVFTSLGTASPGAVYIGDMRRHLVVVRSHHRSGRVSIQRWDPEGDRWR